MTNTIETKTQTATKTCTGKCNESLCWNCRYATGNPLPNPIYMINKKTGKKVAFHSCPWASRSVHVPGWDAEKTVINNRENGGQMNSYMVKKCPHFKADLRQETTIEEIIKELNLPVRFGLCNRLAFKELDYYETYKMFIEDAKRQYNMPKLTSDIILKVKEAAATACAEDLEYDLNEGEITQEEYDLRIEQLQSIKDIIIKYHDKKIARKKN